MTDDAKTIQPRHLEYILGLTAFAAGTVDIISFAKLGGSLASAMTGNLALLALYLARGSFRAALGSVSALCGFVIGSATASLLSRNRSRDLSLTILLAAEVILLAGFIPLWYAMPHKNSGLNADVLITLLAVSMGLQSIVGKKIDLSSIPTIVFTSTLTNIVIALTDMVVRGDYHLPNDTKRQSASFLLYFFGAFCAGFLVYLDAACVVALPLAAIGTALVVQLLTNSASGRMFAKSV